MQLTKAIVPIAGLGTRLFPATRACKKELFPVVGPDRIVRALLHHQLRDLLRAGFTEIALIVPPGGEALVRDYFGGMDATTRARLAADPALERECEEMAQILDTLSFVEQPTPEGFGHAVYQARAFAGGGPILLCTGDLLYRGPCHRELVEAYETGAGRSVSAVTRIGADQLHGYGTIAGRRRHDRPALLDIDLMVEKPSVAIARERLRIPDLPADTWLGWFGLHALSPGIFEILEEMIHQDARIDGEIQLTAAQERLRQRDGYLALEMTTSQRFDFGLPGGLLASMVAFAQPD